MAFDTSQVVAALLGGGALTGAGGWLIKRAERPEREQTRVDGLLREYVDDIRDDLRRADATIERLEKRVDDYERDNDDLRRTNQRLTARVGELEQRLGISPTD